MTPADRSGLPRPLVAALLMNFVWINVSETVRYFAVLRGLLHEAFPQLPDVAPMSVPIFLIWGIWDTIVIAAITGLAWLYLERFGGGWRSVLIAATCCWLAMFVVLWLGVYNMNLATLKILAAMLPWAWAETVIAVKIVDWVRERLGRSQVLDHDGNNRLILELMRVLPLVTPFPPAPPSPP